MVEPRINADELHESYTRLTKAYEAAARLWRAAAEELDDPGRPPSLDAIEAGVEARRELERFMATIRVALASNDDEAMSGLDRPELSLREVGAMLERLQARRRERVVGVRSLAEAAARIGPRATGAVSTSVEAAIAEVHATARVLRMAADGTTPLGDLLSEHTALADLVRLVNEQSDLDDDVVDQLEASVAKTYGEALAKAAARGRLEFVEQLEDQAATHADDSAPDDMARSDTSAAEPDGATTSDPADARTHHDTGDVSEPPAPAPPEEDDQALDQDGSTTEDPDEPDDDPGSRDSGEANVHQSESSNQEPGGSHQEKSENASGTVDEAETGEHPPHSDTPMVMPYLDPSQGAAELASAIQSAAVTDRRPLLAELVVQLLVEERDSLAFHVASLATEIGSPPRRELPVPLVRALALGRNLRHAAGDLALLLEQDLRDCEPYALPDDDDDTWNQGLRLLLAGAALQPALLAPRVQASASAILKELRFRGLERFRD